MKLRSPRKLDKIAANDIGSIIAGIVHLLIVVLQDVLLSPFSHISSFYIVVIVGPVDMWITGK
jgi:hypothetical protein